MNKAVLHTLEAALWAFNRNDNFKDGALDAVNLGEDSDTTGAVYGQLAGAYYGEYLLPVHWLEYLAKVHIFYLKAQEILECVNKN